MSECPECKQPTDDGNSTPGCFCHPDTRVETTAHRLAREQLDQQDAQQRCDRGDCEHPAHVLARMGMQIEEAFNYAHEITVPDYARSYLAVMQADLCRAMMDVQDMARRLDTYGQAIASQSEGR